MSILKIALALIKKTIWKEQNIFDSHVESVFFVVYAVSVSDRILFSILYRHRYEAVKYRFLMSEKCGFHFYVVFIFRKKIASDFFSVLLK